MQANRRKKHGRADARFVAENGKIACAATGEEHGLHGPVVHGLHDNFDRAREERTSGSDVGIGHKQ
jgi:hypothetical protein